MLIQLSSKVWLTSVPGNFVLARVATVKGKYVLLPFAYFSNLRGLLHGVISGELLGSDAQVFPELVSQIEVLIGKIEQLNDKLNSIPDKHISEFDFDKSGIDVSQVLESVYGPVEGGTDG